ncbi:hypothetical protein, partial [Escherichia coli]|uniref:hypothetical protein n=1 Tax=Escherichia coli TaxID=562 RepID=UPI0019536E7F
AAIRAVERHQHALGEAHGDPDRYAAAGARVMAFYSERIEGLGEDMASEARAQERLASELRLVGIQAERARLLE